MQNFLNLFRNFLQRSLQKLWDEWISSLLKFFYIKGSYCSWPLKIFEIFLKRIWRKAFFHISDFLSAESIINSTKFEKETFFFMLWSLPLCKLFVGRERNSLRWLEVKSELFENKVLFHFWWSEKFYFLLNREKKDLNKSQTEGEFVAILLQ